MCESSLMRGFERTRSPSITVTATAPRVTVLAVRDGRRLADGGGIDVAGSVGVAVVTSVAAVFGDDDMEGVGGIEATELLHPALRTTTLSNAMTGWMLMPRIVAPGRADRRWSKPKTSRSDRCCGWPRNAVGDVIA